MPKLNAMPLPATNAIRKLGRELRLARIKRRISTADMATRINATRKTLQRLEYGDPTVSVGVLATTLFVLQLHDRLGSVAAPGTDDIGLELTVDHLPQRIRRKKAT